MPCDWRQHTRVQASKQGTFCSNPHLDRHQTSGSAAASAGAQNHQQQSRLRASPPTQLLHTAPRLTQWPARSPHRAGDEKFVRLLCTSAGVKKEEKDEGGATTRSPNRAEARQRRPGPAEDVASPKRRQRRR